MVGWAKVKRGKLWHFFQEGKSLCGSAEEREGEPLLPFSDAEASHPPVKARCAACNRKARSDSLQLKVGDEVQWKSQSQGYWKEKRGLVVAIVPAGADPYQATLPWSAFPKTRFDSLPRLTESYIVSAKGHLFWPRVSALRRVRQKE